MASLPAARKVREVDYPDSDGRPMAETPQHRKNMTNTIETLEVWFAADADVYVSGNMFVYYVPGNRLRHVSPDVFVAKDVPKVRTPERRVYLVWEEGQPPALVIEFTSQSTREEDMEDKFRIYQDVLRVQEYFLFDPFGEYLDPPLWGYRLRRGKYVRIRPVKGRLPSKVLGPHLEADGWQLRLYDPKARRRLPTPAERAEEAEAARRGAEAEVRRLRRELEALRRRPPGEPG
jgi:Uma2 family endonuclease